MRVRFGIEYPRPSHSLFSSSGNNSPVATWRVPQTFHHTQKSRISFLLPSVDPFVGSGEEGEVWVVPCAHNAVDIDKLFRSQLYPVWSDRNDVTDGAEAAHKRRRERKGTFVAVDIYVKAGSPPRRYELSSARVRL